MTATIPMILSDDVKKARADGTALVALESTLISHGLPHPENIAVARAAEDAVRQHGSTPATIAVMEGKAHIGLELSPASESVGLDVEVQSPAHE